jgi:cytochrome c oxidase subunit IV
VNNGGRDQTRRSWWLWQGPALVWLALLVLFGASFASAYLPLGTGNIAVNLLIAAIMIVVLVTFLMDLKNATALIRVVAAAGLLWLILMFALTFSDYLSRYY